MMSDGSNYSFSEIDVVFTPFTESTGIPRLAQLMRSRTLPC